jgi:hypothetical protein
MFWGGGGLGVARVDQWGFGWWRVGGVVVWVMSANPEMLFRVGVGGVRIAGRHWRLLREHSDEHT